MAQPIQSVKRATTRGLQRQGAGQIRSMASDFAVSKVNAWFERAERQLDPAKPFVIGPRALTYGELGDGVRRLSALFRQLELRRDDRAVVATSDDIAAVSGGRVSEDRQEDR
jgi:hypothetical protein